MMDIIVPKHVVSHRRRAHIQAAVVLAAGSIFMIALGLALFAVPLTPEGEDPSDVLIFLRLAVLFFGVIAALVGVGLFLRGLSFREDNTDAMILGQYLTEEGYFDDSYTYIRNINRRKIGYIDAVLVGLPGVLVFRVVGLQGKFLNEGANWMREDRMGRWQPLQLNPTKHVVEDVNALKEYLTEKGLNDIPVYGFVVFLRDDPIAALTLKEPVVPATHMTSLYRRLQQNYLAKDRIDRRTARQIVEWLGKED